MNLKIRKPYVILNYFYIFAVSAKVKYKYAMVKH